MIKRLLSFSGPEKYAPVISFHAAPISVGLNIDDVTDKLIPCTCPHHVHRNAFCKHRAAKENATDDGTLNAFPSEDDDDETEPEDCERATVASRACERDKQNCRTNHYFSCFYPWHAN